MTNIDLHDDDFIILCQNYIYFRVTNHVLIPFTK